MKTQHVAWACVLGVSSVAGILLGSSISGRPATNAPVDPIIVDVGEPALPDLPIVGFDDHHGVRVAELESESMEVESDPDANSLPQPPAVLPHSRDAQPLVPQPDPAHDALVRRMIADRLPHASAEEREVWFEELRGLAPEMLEEVLEIRSALGSIVPRTPVQFDILPERTDVVDDAPAPGPIQATPVPSGSPGPAVHPEHERILRASLAAAQSARQVLLNNVANARTTAFRRRRPVLASLPYLEMTAVDDVPHGPRYVAQLGNGAALVGTLVDPSPGELEMTNRPLDVAINGVGWFQVQIGERVAYTRDGTFTLDADGVLVTVAGLPLEPAITIPDEATEIGISPSGAVSVRIAGTEDREEVGRLETVRFGNPDGLRPLGDNLYDATELSGAADVGSPGQRGRGGLRQGFREASNVDLDREMRELDRLAEWTRVLERLLGDAPAIVRPPVLVEPIIPEPTLSEAPPTTFPVIVPVSLPAPTE